MNRSYGKLLQSLALIANTTLYALFLESVLVQSSFFEVVQQLVLVPSFPFLYQFRRDLQTTPGLWLHQALNPFSKRLCRDISL